MNWGLYQAPVQGKQGLDTWKHQEPGVFGHAHLHKIQISATLMSQGLLLLSRVAFLSSFIYITKK